MASQQLMQSVPTFPDSLPIADVAEISLAKLAEGDEAEGSAVLESCRHLGFFLLDLRNTALGDQITAELDQVFGIVKETMQMETKEKLVYEQDPPRHFWGFKMQGSMKTETGRPDRCTFYTIAQDDLLGNTAARPAPEPIRQSRAVLKAYVEHLQEVLDYIFGALEKSLGLPAGTFRQKQATDKESGTGLRMIRYAPSLAPDEMRTGLLPHTDFGTVTLLANVVGGLQVLLPGREPDDEGAWHWVKPRARCLIVNIGDCMVEWTAGVLRSNMHRVTFAPGDQRFVERLALAFLVRAEKGVPMRRIAAGRIPREEDDIRDGVAGEAVGLGDLSAAEWALKKALMLYEGRDIARSRGGRELRAGL